MTDPKALIAEARARHDALMEIAKPHDPAFAAGLLEDAALFRRLAAAMEEATKPKIIPGMAFVAEIEHGAHWTMLPNGAVLVTHPEHLAYTMSRNSSGGWDKSIIQLGAEPWPGAPTAREAMAALDGEETTDGQ
ncbi:MAG: hypothetical protein RL328_2647 [Acidobacteriota bacterium]